MKIATVIVVYGDQANAKECIASLKRSRLSDHTNEIIVIDNTKKNRGFSGGYNEGIRQALNRSVDAVLLVNDDTKVDPDAINRMADMLSYQPETTSVNSKARATEITNRIGVVVPKIYFYSGYEYHRQRYKTTDRGRVLWYAGGEIDWNNVLGIHLGVDEVDKGQFNKAKPVTFATGCCLMIRTDTIREVGLLDDRYYLYLEDLDLSVRLARAGWQMHYQPKAVIWHKNAQSSGVGSQLHDYFFARNRLLFGMTYAPLRTKLALMRESGRILLSGSQWKKRGVIDFYLRRFGQGSWKEDK